MIYGVVSVIFAHFSYDHLFIALGQKHVISITYLAVLLTVHLNIILVIKLLNAKKSCFIISLLYASTCFEHYVLIIRRSNCIILHLVSSYTVGGRPVHRIAT